MAAIVLQSATTQETYTLLWHTHHSFYSTHCCRLCSHLGSSSCSSSLLFTPLTLLLLMLPTLFLLMLTRLSLLSLNITLQGAKHTSCCARWGVWQRNVSKLCAQTFLVVACCGTLGLTELPHSSTPLTMVHATSWYGNTPVITRAKLVAAWAYLMPSHKLRSEQIVLRAGGCGQLQQQASRAGQACHHLHTYVHLSMSMHCKGPQI